LKNEPTQVVIYDQVTDLTKTMSDMGTVITKSQIFGCQNIEQGQILALECMAKKMSPLTLAETYDLIGGRLSMKSDAMLAGFEQAGGEYEIKEYSPDACEIVFSRGKSKLPIRISWEDAQKESWPYGKGGKIKQNWSTPIGRQDMLFARVVSRGVRRLAPSVVCGRYTPEELNDIPQEATVRQVQPAEVKEPVPTKPAEVIQDAEFEVKDPGKTSASTDEPCTEAMVTEIKAAIEQAAQVDGKELVAKIREKLKNSGLAKLSDLSMAEADMLLVAIQSKNTRDFFDASLAGHTKN